MEVKEIYENLGISIIEFEGNDVIVDSLPAVDDNNWSGWKFKTYALCHARRAFLFSLPCQILKNSLGSLFIARDLLKYA